MFTVSFNAVKEWCATAHPGVGALTLHHFLSFSIAHSLIKKHLGLGNDDVGNNEAGVAARADVFIDGKQLRRSVLLKQPLTDIWLQFAQATQPPTIEFNVMTEDEECDCLTFAAVRDEEDEYGGKGETDDDDEDGDDNDDRGAEPESREVGEQETENNKNERVEAPNETEEDHTLARYGTSMDCEQNMTGVKRDGGGDTPSSKRSKAEENVETNDDDEGTSTVAMSGDTARENESEL